MVVLLVATVAALTWGDALLARRIVLTPASSYVSYAYGDESVGGSSIVTTDPRRPLEWQCELRDGAQYPFCGYEVLFDAERYERGLDLSNFATVTLDLSYRGSAETLGIYLKNHDPRYSAPGRSESAKFNKVEFPAAGAPQRVQLQLSDFSVADWWLVANRIRPELSRPQFDNVISISLQTGSGSQPGAHRFAIRSITLEGAALSKAQWYLAILTAWLVLIGLYLGFRISRLKKDLEEKRLLEAVAQRHALAAEETARRDHLTGLLNRAGVTALYEELVADPETTRSVSVILIDADHFKSINDRFGHNHGDEVLRAFARVLKQNVRAEDILGRWGGEEFIVVCRNLDGITVLEMAEKLRRRVEQADFGDCGRVTASFGTYWCETGFESFATLVSQADTALYVAKSQGRNRAIMYHPFMKKAA